MQRFFSHWLSRPATQCKRFLVTAALLVLGYTVTGFATAQSTGTFYEAVIDAGSSGTRLYLYEHRSGPQGPMVSMLFEDEPDSLRGLSNYADKPEQAGQNEIDPLLIGLKTFINTNGIDQRAVTVSVLATAGMRLVDSTASGLIYDSVRQVIASREFVAREVGTITGQSEGIYAWVDLNYLRGNLRPGQPTEGIVEIGGASAQVAFAVDSPDPKGSFVRRVSIGDQVYDVLSVSYLGLGQNEARRAMIKVATDARLPLNPCYPNSQSENVVFDGVQARQGNAGLNMAGSDSSFSLACFDLYAGVVKQTSGSHVNRLPISQLRLVPSFDSSRFVLMASFFHALRDWDLLDHKRWDRGMLAEVFARCVGQDAWLTVSGRQGAGFFAQNACANVTYLYSFIFSAGGLALSSSRVEVLEEVNGLPLTWTRGYALLAAGSLR